jgi:hypothetical protein
VETFDGVCGASDAEVDVVDEIRASAPADQIRLESVVAADGVSRNSRVVSPLTVSDPKRLLEERLFV